MVLVASTITQRSLWAVTCLSITAIAVSVGCSTMLTLSVADIAYSANGPDNDQNSIHFR
jgi:hypothetical protein